ncbi:unnamed protein product, partial [Amoebophrya sp. A25]|eukprot:GSA25T00003949001.1
MPLAPVVTRNDFAGEEGVFKCLQWLENSPGNALLDHAAAVEELIENVTAQPGGSSTTATTNTRSSTAQGGSSTTATTNTR